MNNWTLFQGVYTNIITPVLAQMQALVGNVAGQMTAVAIALMGIWLVLGFFELANQTKSIEQLGKELFMAGLMLSLLQTGQYMQYVGNLFIQDIPSSFGAMLGAAQTPMAALDHTMALVVTAGTKTYYALPSYSLKILPLGIAILFYLGFSAVSLSYCFGVFMVAALINTVAVVVGPIFLALAVTPQTRRFASGWLGVLVGGCVTQLMSQAVIQLLSGAEGIMIQQVTVTAAASDSNSIEMLWSLCQVGLLIWLGKEVVKEIPQIARAIGGGVHHNANAISKATFGTAGTVVQATTTLVQAGAGAVGSHAASQVGAGAVRASTPAGPSLSAGRATP